MLGFLTITVTLHHILTKSIDGITLLKVTCSKKNRLMMQTHQKQWIIPEPSLEMLYRSILKGLKLWKLPLRTQIRTTLGLAMHPQLQSKRCSQKESILHPEGPWQGKLDFRLGHLSTYWPCMTIKAQETWIYHWSIPIWWWADPIQWLTEWAIKANP